MRVGHLSFVTVTGMTQCEAYGLARSVDNPPAALMYVHTNGHTAQRVTSTATMTWLQGCLQLASCRSQVGTGGMPCTQCARSAKFWMSANIRTLVSAPFHKFLVPYQGFF